MDGRGCGLWPPTTAPGTFEWADFLRKLDTSIPPRLVITDKAHEAANDELVIAQAGVRHLLPDHHSTAALDTHLGTVRDYLDSRSFVLRNQTRTP